MWKPPCKLVELYSTHIMCWKCRSASLLYIIYQPAFNSDC